MHHMQIGNYSINFNGDFSGDIIVNEENGRGFIGNKEVARIPFMVMSAIVGEKIRREKMERLEKADPLELIYGEHNKNW